MNSRRHSDTLQNALLAGAAVFVATAGMAALRGRIDSGSAIAPINASTHALYGVEAADAETADLKHTLPGLAINAAGSVFWAAIFEWLFGRTARRYGVAGTLLAGAAVAALAYLVDYRLIPKRLTPGWEARVSAPSLGMIFSAMAAALPLRSLLERALRR